MLYRSYLPKDSVPPHKMVVSILKKKDVPVAWTLASNQCSLGNLFWTEDIALLGSFLMPLNCPPHCPEEHPYHFGTSSQDYLGLRNSHLQQLCGTT